MDHYDVLGVRRSATAEEISLAYRGRRAQYHPDKYSNSTADALQWATGKMQEVNVAYAVLSDPAKRARFDAEFKGRSGASDAREDEEDEEGEDDADESGATEDADAPSLREVLARRLGGRSGHQRIYLAPNIPMKKLSSALQSYGSGVDADDVVVLVDSTVFGGAREGVMLTQEALLAKDIISDPVRVKWSDVRRIEGSGSFLYVNARKTAECALVDDTQLERLFATVQVFVAARQSPGASTAGKKQEPRQSGSRRQRNREIFNTVKRNLLAVCEWLERIESDHEQLVDRDAAAEEFEALEDHLDHPPSESDVLEELGEVNLLCVQLLALVEDRDAEIDEDLLEDQEDDSQLVGELRSVLRTCVDILDEAQRKKRTAQFFKR